MKKPQHLIQQVNSEHLFLYLRLPVFFYKMPTKFI